MRNYNCICPSPYVGCHPIDQPNTCERCGGLVAERSEVVSAPQRCKNCGQPHSKHSTIGAECPDGRDKRFEVDSVDGGARPDSRQWLDAYEKKFRKNRKRAMQWSDIAEMLDVWATDGGARELEQAAQVVIDTWGDDSTPVEVNKLNKAVEALRLAVDRRKR
jgi:hypothetical protein